MVGQKHRDGGRVTTLDELSWWPQTEEHICEWEDSALSPSRPACNGDLQKTLHNQTLNFTLHEGEQRPQVLLRHVLAVEPGLRLKPGSFNFPVCTVTSSHLPILLTPQMAVLKSG